MKAPHIVHPIKFEINGFFFEVKSYRPLSYEEAAAAAQMTYRSIKPKKLDKGKTFTVNTTFGADS